MNIGSKKYLVHFETGKHMSKKGNRELIDVTCVISDADGNIIAKGTANQNYHDKCCDMVLARKVAFGKAVNYHRYSDEVFIKEKIFSKAERTQFHKEYQKRCRYKRQIIRKSRYERDPGKIEAAQQECKV